MLVAQMVRRAAFFCRQMTYLRSPLLLQMLPQHGRGLLIFAAGSQLAKLLKAVYKYSTAPRTCF